MVAFIEKKLTEGPTLVFCTGELKKALLEKDFKTTVC
jgi:hypothetical protein